MKLTASPFDPQTGELLPVYRDAYLNGDLSRSSARAVENYLRRDADVAHDTITRWQELQATDEVEVAPTWVQKQIQYIRAEPVRFRRRATSMVASAVLVGSMVFAGTSLPGVRTSNSTFSAVNETATAGATAEALASNTASMAAAASSKRMIMVQGRILNENGKPLPGATVMQPGSRQIAVTNAAGEYVLHVPVGTSSLKYGYGGYQDEEIKVSDASADVTLLPSEKTKRHWWSF
ncbi:carboxypeptidase-like regulatory domain-containing protein [Hymenobacter aerilatus]|uniref:Carboxypeptidase-like regulatory domain-containing protein n=1 Tax=Hymenobacter aerilatus TaxID=2932251 RepID=A0A8T9SYM3_9BACT|nr:carboxypeptidase-like regulatory domain-containing protein [Hymenobacter aerilatus]UOR04879.1 carboxypeptidase-like regulatory domain-containing protein [Hymenobacter aerilatus]